MKKIFLSILFFLNILTNLFAENIKDFEIEGISIGDSALDHFKKDQLINDENYYYKNKKYAGIIWFDNLEIYDDIQVTFDPNDKNLKIVSVRGSLNFKNDIQNCYSKQNEIVSDLEEIFSNLKKIEYEQPHEVDKTGDSVGKAVDLEFDNGDSVRVICMDWSEKLSNEKNWWDALNVTINSDKFLNWLTNYAYN